MNDDQFRKLLDHLGYRWEGYRKVRKGVKKRIYRHMQRLGCRNIDEYLKAVDQQNDCYHECELLMTVSISRFFRDRRLWQTLEEQWLPDIIAKHPEKIKVWSAGCACGEEPYSFKIIWDQLVGRMETLPKLELIASDRHPGYIERARKGIYGLGSLKALTSQARSAYFEGRKAKQVEIKAILKKNIDWKVHHLLADPPGQEFNIIFLRNNILTYYRKEFQKKALDVILPCLLPGGLLVIGCHESLPTDTPTLTPLLPFSYVFQTRN